MRVTEPSMLPRRISTSVSNAVFMALQTSMSCVKWIGNRQRIEHVFTEPSNAPQRRYRFHDNAGDAQDSPDCNCVGRVALDRVSDRVIDALILFVPGVTLPLGRDDAAH